MMNEFPRKSIPAVDEASFNADGRPEGMHYGSGSF
jgi:hypothetical protein